MLAFDAHDRVPETLSAGDRPMPTSLYLSIPGLPKGKPRPRFNRRSGRAYTPGDAVELEKWIAAEFRRKYPGHRPFTGPVMVRFTAIFPMPASLTAAARQAALEGRLYHTGKPDKENVEKLLWDALTGVCWVDDSQCQGGGTKRYGLAPRVDMMIEELEGLPETPSDRRRRKKIEQLGLGLGRR